MLVQRSQRSRYVSDIVWEVAKTKAAKLKRDVETILRAEEPTE